MEEDTIAWVGKPDDCHVNCDLILDGDVSDNIISDQIMILVMPCNVNVGILVTTTRIEWVCWDFGETRLFGILTHPDRMDRKTPPTPL